MTITSADKVESLQAESYFRFTLSRRRRASSMLLHVRTKPASGPIRWRKLGAAASSWPSLKHGHAAAKVQWAEDSSPVASRRA